MLSSNGVGECHNAKHALIRRERLAGSVHTVNSAMNINMTEQDTIDDTSNAASDLQRRNDAGFDGDKRHLNAADNVTRDRGGAADVSTHHEIPLGVSSDASTMHM